MLRLFQDHHGKPHESQKLRWVSQSMVLRTCIPLLRYSRHADTPAQSKECQLNDWRYHKQICKLQAKLWSNLNENKGTRLLNVIHKWAERYSFVLNAAANQVLLEFKNHNTNGHLLNSHAFTVHVKQTGPQSGKFTIVSAEKSEQGEKNFPSLEGTPPDQVAQFLDFRQRLMRIKGFDIEARTGRKFAGFLYVYIDCEGLEIPYSMDFFVDEETAGRGAQQKWDPHWEKALKWDVNEDVKFYKTEDGNIFELTMDGNCIPRGILGGSTRLRKSP